MGLHGLQYDNWSLSSPAAVADVELRGKFVAMLPHRALYLISKLKTPGKEQPQGVIIVSLEFILSSHIKKMLPSVSVSSETPAVLSIHVNAPS